ncbi:MAG: hypothetical protein LBD18_06185 [Treponema sp.]|jgi:hypothetical protein|nr:hypothetical protein [Treponema sp.]
MFLDHDDIMNEGALSVLYQELEKDLDAGLVEAGLEDFVSCRRRLHNANMGRTLQKQENRDYLALLLAKLAGGRREFKGTNRFLIFKVG